MIWVYKSRASTQAAALARALGGRRGRQAGWEAQIAPGDIVINWGDAAIPTNRPAKAWINNRTPLTTLQLYQVLSRSSVPIPEFSTIKPVSVQENPNERLELAWEDAVEQADAFLTAKPERHEMAIAAVSEFIQSLQAVVAEQRRPPEPQAPLDDGRWIGRSAGVSINDIATAPQFWVRRVDLTAEYLLHVFNSVVILSGSILHGERRTEYNSPAVPASCKLTAVRAVLSLGLRFAAVSVGVKSDGNPVIFSVNQTPRLNENTLPVYTTAINEFVRGLG